MRPTAAPLEAAITRVIAATRDAPQGPLYVKVALDGDDRDDAETFNGGLFLSMPYIGGDRQGLARVMAHVRENFNGNEQFLVIVGEEEEYSAFNDAGTSARLLNLLSPLEITPR